jgi:NAD+ diphosphatase
MAVREVVEHGRTLARNVCSGCDAIAYSNPVPVVMAVIEKNGQVLMTRNLDWPKGMLGYCAGFLETEDASPEAGMAREMQEELGLTVAPERLRLLGVASMRRLRQLVVLYHVELRPEEEPVRNAEELAEIRWVPLAKLKLSWSEGPGPLIKAFVAARLQSKL